MQIKFESELLKIGAKIDRYAKRQREKAAEHIEFSIREKANAVKIRGNLAAGVYHKHMKNTSFVGIHAPGYQNYLVEMGHHIRKTRSGPSFGFVPAHPIVYPSFTECADRAIQIMSEPMGI